MSRLLLLLNPNYSNTPGGGVGGRNRRPSRRKKPIINVIEGRVIYDEKLPSTTTFIYISLSQILQIGGTICDGQQKNTFLHQ